MPQASTDGEAYEDQHVHRVYAQIAPHFSQTRYKPWPLIASFLLSLPRGSIGLDIGCGNGKYLALNPSIYIIGSDRSRELVGIAYREKSLGNGGAEAVVGDILDLPHGRGRFDFAISIAVVHHLSTRGRRVAAIASILETLKLRQQQEEGEVEAGKALIYVWALEQKTSRRGWDVGQDQDVMVPWVMKGRNAAVEGSNTTTTGSEEKTFKRYYHLYREGELEGDIRDAGGVVLSSGYERDNWWAIASPKSQTYSSDPP